LPVLPGRLDFAMRIHRLHKWGVSAAEAIRLQSKLAVLVQTGPQTTAPRLVAGLDCAFSKDGRKVIAGAVVLRLPDLILAETAWAARPVRFPYIPGLLSFREAPACLAAVAKLKSTPDVFVVDGQGIAHPRRLGLAAHLGLFFERPTIGCAKSRLVGSYRQPAPEKGAYSLLKDTRPTPAGHRSKKPTGSTQTHPHDHPILRRTTKDEQVIGAVVRTRTNVKPVFVSIGHKCTLTEAVNLCLALTSRYRLPEPLRLAHQLVGSLKSKI
jgi:deoxyribonuclease V